MRFLLFVFSILANGLLAQPIQLLPTTLLSGPDGITMDKKGNLYVANWGKDANGKTIVKIDKKGRETIFTDNLAAPDGLTFDKTGDLYISCFASGEIIKVNKNGIRTIFATGLDHPCDLKFDKNGNLYVSSFGNYNGTKIYKITSKGQVSTFADSLKVPLGLTFDEKENLYVTNFASGAITKITPAGKKTLYAQLPANPPGYFQYLAFDKKGNLYCPSFGQNAIYKINKNGEISKLDLKTSTGTAAVLKGPNSIYIKGNTLYFTEFSTGAAYKVRI